jgi:DNA-binding SARP family transcriptional activator
VGAVAAHRAGSDIVGAARRLVNTRRYREAASVLLDLERSTALRREPGARQVLEAAREIVLSCVGHGAEAAAHRRAALEAEALERDQRERAKAILDLVIRRAPGRDPEPRAAREGVAPGPSPAAGAELSVYCLGPMRVERASGALVTCSSHRGRSVLQYLVAQRARPAPKEVLMDLFWPDASPRAARNRLNVAIYGLRRALHGVGGGPFVLYRDNTYFLNPELPVWVDLEEFERLFASARRRAEAGDHAAAVRDYLAAERLYAGDLFEDDPHEDWLLPRRRALAASYLDLLSRLAAHFLATRDLEACAATLEGLLAREPWREDAHRDLMRCYARQGRHHLALRQYRICREALAEGIDAAPAQETAELYARVRRREAV